MLDRRILALAFDGALLLTSLVIFGTSIASLELTALVLQKNFPAALLGFATLPLLQYIVIYPAGLVYFTLFEGKYGQSPGKKLLGIKVVDEDYDEIGYESAFKRRLLDIIDCLPILWIIGGLSILSGGRDQRLGDRVAGTQVVRDHGETWGEILS